MNKSSIKYAVARFNALKNELEPLGAEITCLVRQHHQGVGHDEGFAFHEIGHKEGEDGGVFWGKLRETIRTPDQPPRVKTSLFVMDAESLDSVEFEIFEAASDNEENGE